MSAGASATYSSFHLGKPFILELMGDVRIDQQGHIAWLILDQLPRRNALSLGMWGKLIECAAELQAAPDVRCVVIRGAGEEAFTSGADITEFGELRQGAEATARYDAVTDRAFAALRGLNMPVLCAIHGFCFGGGVGIALCADLRYAADDARFALPPAKLGVGYGMENLRIAAEGMPIAGLKELLFTGQAVGAERARELGLVSQVFSKGSLDSRVTELALAIAANAPLSIQATKAGLRALTRRSAAELASAEQLMLACADSEDYREGVAAFKEKRAPRFRGV